MVLFTFLPSWALKISISAVALSTYEYIVPSSHVCSKWSGLFYAFLKDEGWKPIDMLEKALADIINENEEENTDVKYNPKSSLFTMREEEKPAIKTGKSKENVKSVHKPKGLVKQERYLALDQPHVNPIPRIQDSASRKRKWPTNAIWVCVYCRLITDDIQSYKKHLTSSHKAG